MLADEGYVKASVLVEWHLQSAVKELARKITIRQKEFEPWTSRFSGEKIHVDMFTLIYEYCEHFLPKIGYTINETWCRNGNIKDVTFTFTKIGVFVHHLKKLSGLTNISDLFKKALKMAQGQKSL